MKGGVWAETDGQSGEEEEEGVGRGDQLSAVEGCRKQ